MAEAAACRDVVQVYLSAAGNVAALRGVDASFPVGTVTVLVGPSGAGKSTLLRLLAGMERPTAGEVIIAGQETAGLSTRSRRALFARHVGYVFQRAQENLFDYLTVAQHADLAHRMRGLKPSAASIESLLAAAGLSDRASDRPAALSAGRQQQLSFALACAGGPSLIVADEPSAELDAQAAAELTRQIFGYVRAGSTFVIATHDPILIDLADQRLVVARGRGQGAA
jgi:putative ABC transport system ATP-binding protein